MTAPRRVVVDPNVFVSAAISPGGATAAVIDLVDGSVILAVVSPKLLAELDGVLRRDMFRDSARADALVSGDADLTDLDLDDLHVLTPRQLHPRTSRSDRGPRPNQPAARQGPTVPIPANDPDHRDATHQRWVARRNRDTASPDYQEAWYAQQCGGCWFYVPLAGAYGYDWGACTNAQSSFDGRVMFEHDGCEHHKSAGDWVTAHDGDPFSDG